MHVYDTSVTEYQGTRAPGHQGTRAPEHHRAPGHRRTCRAAPSEPARRSCSGSPWVRSAWTRCTASSTWPSRGSWWSPPRTAGRRPPGGGEEEEDSQVVVWGGGAPRALARWTGPQAHSVGTRYGHFVMLGVTECTTRDIWNTIKVWNAFIVHNDCKTSWVVSPTSANVKLNTDNHRRYCVCNANGVFF